MKTIIIILSVVLMISCDNPPKGSVVKVSDHPDIELSKFYYDDAGSFVFVAKYVGDNTTTATWNERVGKATVKKSTVFIAKK